MNNEELVVLYQQGNRQALEKLLDKNKNLIYKIANKFYTDGISSVDKDDLIQEGNIGFIMVCDRYDINNEKKATFITYAFHWVYSKMHRFITNRDTNEETSLNKPVGEEESELIDLLESNRNDIENIQEKIYLQELRDELEGVMNNTNTLHEREVLKLYYGWETDPLTMEGIADILETSSDKIRQSKDRAIRKMRNSTWGRVRIRERLRSNRTYNNVIREVDYESELNKSRIWG
ncbi:sigma-70 family RNA polymerase sigma factor [Clostridium sardiniense]|uniref:sigma-70 family RNA polymerase sigma factor n=1 Tax=Clostridium sardiniense TaxID=29369 RepID=UPI00195F15EB|nr:sigma-70 family RNA polymerase sigma factor [Clostridium sardiniense]MBM7834996.1 RNA polymerase sigma factor (sigma-70 family) [Clostridium sardiniense]